MLGTRRAPASGGATRGAYASGEPDGARGGTIYGECCDSAPRMYGGGARIGLAPYPGGMRPMTGEPRS